MYVKVNGAATCIQDSFEVKAMIPDWVDCQGSLYLTLMLTDGCFSADLVNPC